MASVIGSVLGALVFISDYPEGYRFVSCMAVFGGLLVVVWPVVYILGFPFQSLIKLLSRRFAGVAFLSFAYGGAVGVVMSVILLWWFDKDPVSLFLAGDMNGFWFSLKAVLVAFINFAALGLFTALNMPAIPRGSDVIADEG